MLDLYWRNLDWVNASARMGIFARTPRLLINYVLQCVGLALGLVLGLIKMTGEHAQLIAMGRGVGCSCPLCTKGRSDDERT